MTNPHDEQSYQERLSGEQASEMPFDAMTDDPTLTAAVDQSDLPVNGADAQTG
jgi:hypothetical protein